MNALAVAAPEPGFFAGVIAAAETGSSKVPATQENFVDLIAILLGPVDTDGTDAQGSEFPERADPKSNVLPWLVDTSKGAKTIQSTNQAASPAVIADALIRSMLTTPVVVLDITTPVAPAQIAAPLDLPATTDVEGIKPIEGKLAGTSKVSGDEPVDQQERDLRKLAVTNPALTHLALAMPVLATPALAKPVKQNLSRQNLVTEGSTKVERGPQDSTKLTPDVASLMQPAIVAQSIPIPAMPPQEDLAAPNAAQVLPELPSAVRVADPTILSPVVPCAQAGPNQVRVQPAPVYCSSPNAQAVTANTPQLFADPRIVQRPPSTEGQAAFELNLRPRPVAAQERSAAPQLAQEVTQRQAVIFGKQVTPSRELVTFVEAPVAAVETLAPDTSSKAALRSEVPSGGPKEPGSPRPEAIQAAGAPEQNEGSGQSPRERESAEAIRQRPDILFGQPMFGKGLTPSRELAALVEVPAAAETRASNASAKAESRTEAPSGSPKEPASPRPEAIQSAAPPRQDGDSGQSARERESADAISKKLIPHRMAQPRVQEQAIHFASPGDGRNPAMDPSLPAPTMPQSQPIRTQESALPARPDAEPQRMPEPHSMTPEPEVGKKPGAAVQEIALRIDQGNAPPVDLHMTQRAGRVQVDVRSQDPAMQSTLRQELGSLVNSLEKAGFQTEAWVPAETRSSRNDPGMPAPYSPNSGMSGDTARENRRNQQQARAQRQRRQLSRLSEIGREDDAA